MSTLSDPAPEPLTWRTCADCDALVPLPPGVELCARCSAEPGTRALPADLPRHGRKAHAEPLRVEHFAAGDLMDIWLAGGTLAAAIEDISHHYIGEPGSWDCYGTAPDEFARLSDALDGMEAAVRESRAVLNRVERRVRARTARASAKRTGRGGSAREGRSA